MKIKKQATPGKREMRSSVSTLPMEVRTTADGSKQVTGYAIVFNSPSVDLGGFTEICSPQMLTRTLRESPDVLALRDHKQELLIGRTTAGTLTLSTDSKGLAFTMTLPKTAIGDDTAENVRLKNLSGVSFGFSVPEGGDSWSVDASGNVVRTLLDIDLYEISITSFPAYEATSVNTRSCPEALRSRLVPSLDEDDMDDDDADDMDLDDDAGTDDEDCCECPCQSCVDGDCENCSNTECDDPFCIGCPQQDDVRADNLRRMRLHALRTQ